jgi:NAD(P)-dependent dehydrogenase (short-subunit alcohol dehydrogenase family)
MASPVILILGAGANTGARLAQTFSKNGFKVALATRTINAHHEKSRDLVIKADFSDPSSIKAVFEEVNAKLGIPNVVVYNGVYFTPQREM